MSRFFRSDTPANSLSLRPISLLNPTPDATQAPPTDASWEADLGLSDLINALSPDRRHRRFIRAILLALPTDPTVIRWRQDILADFVENPALVDTLEALLPHIAGLTEDNALLGKQSRSLLMQTSDRLGELDMYTELLAALHDALANTVLKSSALRQLRDDIARVLALPDYQRLRDELPALRAPLQNIGSLTIGINLDYNLRPTSAVLMAINTREVGEPPSLLDRLFRPDDPDEQTPPLKGVGPVHHFPKDRNQRPYHDLFQDVDKLLHQTAKPIAESLRYYVRTNSQVMVHLEQEIAFYVAAARLLQRTDVPFCQPEIAPQAERTAQADQLHNIALLCQGDVRSVPSDIRFDQTGRIAVLTGPNSGGKTTFLRNIGLAQVMFQAGLFVPAQAARFSPVDHIFTHFPRLETREQGRLAEESARLRTALQHATAHSLILLNETFSSTAFAEALYLAQDVLAAMCAIGVRAVFATHLAELADAFDTIEAGIDTNSRLFSLVAGVKLQDDGSATPTYQITRRPPLGRSYAEEIARRHGISFSQIMAHRAQVKPSSAAKS